MRPDAPALSTLAGRSGLALIALLVLTAAGGKPPTTRKSSRTAQPAATATGDESLPPLDLILPPEEPAPAVAAPPAEPSAAPSASPRRLRLSAGVGPDVAGAGFDLTAGLFVAASRRVVDTGPLALEAGLRASYAPRIRQELVDVPGRGELPAAVFYAHTGDVSLTCATTMRPLEAHPLEVGVEAGVGLAWRSGHQTLLDRRFDAGGVGVASHVALRGGWRLSPALLVGLRAELASQPQPVRIDAPVMPTNLGALRTMLTAEFAP